LKDENLFTHQYQSRKTIPYIIIWKVISWLNSRFSGFIAETIVKTDIRIALAVCKIKKPKGINHSLCLKEPVKAIINMAKRPITFIPLHGSPIQTP
jgi:hypothetical protein